MNIAIIGYGKMGKEIEKLAKLKKISVISTIDPGNSGAKYKEINEASMKNVDVCIDFSVPKAVAGNVRRISSFRKNIAIGTTGWNDGIDEVKEIVKKTNIGLIYASNFSVGVNVFFRILENASKIISRIEGYDVYGYELHHNKKIDAPSGTAKTIEGILSKNLDKKQKINFASVRSGFIPGTHVVGFDSSADTIELKHVARNREGFALGAIMAAEWIKNKKGFYSINDMMDEVMGGG